MHYEVWYGVVVVVMIERLDDVWPVVDVSTPSRPCLPPVVYEALSMRAQPLCGRCDSASRATTVLQLLCFVEALWRYLTLLLVACAVREYVVCLVADDVRHGHC